MGTPTPGHSNCPAGVTFALTCAPCPGYCKPACRAAAATTLQASLPRQPTVPDCRVHSCPRFPLPDTGFLSTSKSGHVCLLLKASLMPHRFRKSEIPRSQALVSSLASGLHSSALFPQKHLPWRFLCSHLPSHRRAHAFASPSAVCASLRSPWDRGTEGLSHPPSCPAPRKAQGRGRVTAYFVHHPLTAVPRTKLTTF